MTSFTSKLLFIIGLISLIIGLLFGVGLLNWIGCIVLGCWLVLNLFWWIVEEVSDKGYE